MAFLNIPIFLLSLLPLPPQVFLTVNEYFSLALFWLENIVYIALFAALEIVLIPFVYIKLLFVIPWATMGLFTSIFYTGFWFVSGIAILIGMAVRDIFYFIRILANHQGFLGDDDDEEEGEDSNIHHQIDIMNNVRIVAFKMYEKIKKEKLGMEFDHEAELKEKNRNYEEENIIA
jgi:hypothetical protein